MAFVFLKPRIYLHVFSAKIPESYRRTIEHGLSDLGQSCFSNILASLLTQVYWINHIFASLDSALIFLQILSQSLLSNVRFKSFSHAFLRGVKAQSSSNNHASLGISVLGPESKWWSCSYRKTWYQIPIPNCCDKSSKDFSIPLWNKSPSVAIHFRHQTFESKVDLLIHNFGFSQILEKEFK